MMTMHALELDEHEANIFILSVMKVHTGNVVSYGKRVVAPG